MNNKRQTIWLVSMLSLMVILSAYYLFTEDSGPVNPPVADSQQVDGMKQGEAQKKERPQKRQNKARKKEQLLHLIPRIKQRAKLLKRTKKFSKRWNSKIQPHQLAVSSRITSGNVRKATIASMRN